MTDEPTDEALENLFVEETGFDIDDFPAAIFDFARAVLAKWGAPQPTQAQAGAVPLTDEQWQRIADLTDSILTRATKDEIERVIGIKGGQHG